MSLQMAGGVIRHMPRVAGRRGAGRGKHCGLVTPISLHKAKNGAYRVGGQDGKLQQPSDPVNLLAQAPRASQRGYDKYQRLRLRRPVPPPTKPEETDRFGNRHH